MSGNLHLEEIHIALSGKTLIELNETVAPGEVLTVMGPSGSGKSSLLAYIAGFLPPAFTARGRIRLGKDDVTALPPERRGIGLLFQDPLLFPHLSVGGNLRFALRSSTPGISGTSDISSTSGISSASSKRKDALIAARLAEIGLPGFASRDPATLSGGQKSRVALLRLLLSSPRAVLLDEPFSALDTTLRAELREHVFTTLHQAALPTILVTHDKQDTPTATSKVLHLSNPHT